MPIIKGVKMAHTAAQIYDKGLHYKGRDDLLLFHLAQGSYVAGTLTRSSMAGAPIIWNKPILKQARAEAIIINAGNANVLNGAKGITATTEIADALGEVLNINPQHILQASTGVIGEVLPHHKIMSHIPNLCNNLTDNAWEQAARAIMTTDTIPKGATASCMIGNKPINIAGIAKGSGMIAPDMATMLSFIFTDALIAPHMLKKITQNLVNQTFNSITVDGDTSTSDMVIVAATGAAQNQLSDDSDVLHDFTKSLHQVMLDLATQIVRDGEGARKFITYHLRGAKNDDSARIIGKSIANSPLVKTAIAGGDANWGRIAMAVGKSGEPASQHDLSIIIADEILLKKGELQSFDVKKLDSYFKGNEIEIMVDIGLGKGEATIYGCDFTEDYIKINADYRS
ncbi:MAG: bifunctional glutamate N-acetyltransferase/amino-acid acetyltransferase ArgJ [Alphaproteobacteria bacterium]|nr:bifunctional glutamate N-acetyltransferase/amino-acid acetyltransferase ArgJ [Alphaproteobacteria bacterium]